MAKPEVKGIDGGCITQTHQDSEKSPKGCGHDVHNWRSGQGRPVCQPHTPDAQVEVQQPEPIHCTVFISLRLLMQLSYNGDQKNSNEYPAFVRSP